MGKGKNMKRTLAVFLLILISVFTISSLKNEEIVNATQEENGDLRAVWMTPITGDVKAYTNESSYKNEMNDILDMLEYYNMNTIIYHVRHHNNALYKSELNPKSTYFSNVNFDLFDPLAWLIEEAHSRGMEFHAWFNPYRLGNYYAEELPMENPASDPNNILKNPNNSALTILNPGLPHVRNFIIDTILEVIENYEVDAVHFDDYFYTNLGANGETSGANTILNEPDQQTFVEYGLGYNTNNANEKANWRREQVNLLVEGVSTAIKAFNEENNRYVQFGISPTGIYKNGNGVVTYDQEGKAITNGSNTKGQTHYSSYLFSDTVKWINEGWLDYILPQSYWATNHSVASYYNVMGWWDKVVKNLNVNLYSGIGVYMADNENTFNWISDLNELNTQFNYLKTLKNVSGSSIYALKHIRNGYINSAAKSGIQFNNGANAHFNTKVVLPVLKSFEPILLPKVNNITLNNQTLSWDEVNEAKFYYIYASNNALQFTNEEIIGVTNKLEFNVGTLNANYGVRALSNSNHLGQKPDELINPITMIEGAAIRNLDNETSQALRFYANLDDSNLNQSEQGFYIIKGNDITREQLLSIINEGTPHINIMKSPIANKDSNGNYSVVVDNINSYNQIITVYAYYKVDNKIYLSNNSTSRSVALVAIRILKANESNIFVESIKENLTTNYNHIGFNAFGVYEEINGIYESNHFILREQFINDWNQFFDTNFDTLQATLFYNNASIGIESATNISNANLYKFLNDNTIKNKWGWLLEYLKSVDSTVHTTTQILAIQSNGTVLDSSNNQLYNLWNARHISHSIANFFNQQHEVGGYTAINFTNLSFYETVLNFNNQIIFDFDTYQLKAK